MIDLWGMLRGPLARLAGRSLGASGERVAERWMRRQGFRVLERNLCVLDDEVDLLALDPDGKTLVIVEVKTRGSDAHGAPEEGVGLVKQKRLARLAARLQQSKRYEGRPVRFDVIAITWPENERPQVKHIPAAFDASW